MSMSRLAKLVLEPGAGHPPGWRPLLSVSGWPMPHPDRPIRRRLPAVAGRSRLALGLLLLVLMVIVGDLS